MFRFTKTRSRFSLIKYFILLFSIVPLASCGAQDPEPILRIYNGYYDAAFDPDTNLATDQVTYLKVGVSPNIKCDVNIVIKSGNENIKCENWDGRNHGFQITALYVGSATIYAKIDKDGKTYKSDDVTFTIAEGDMILDYNSLGLSEGDNSCDETTYFDRHGSGRYHYIYQHIQGNSSSKSFYLEENSYLGANVFSNINKFKKIKVVLKEPATEDATYFGVSNYVSGYSPKGISFKKGNTESTITYTNTFAYFMVSKTSPLIDRIVFWSDYQN